MALQAWWRLSGCGGALFDMSLKLEHLCHCVLSALHPYPLICILCL